MLLEAIFAIGTIIITEFARVACREVIEQWTSRSKENASNHGGYSERTNKTPKDIINDIEIIDTEIVDLERKKQRDIYVPISDNEHLEYLEFLRNEKFNDYQKAKKKEIAEEQYKNPDNYETSVLKNDSIHVLQYHMGQVVLEKKCAEPGCGKPMILQSRKRLDGSLYCLDDFFWSCTGYYSNLPFKCNATQKFQAKDTALLHKSDIFEFQLSQSDLSRIFNEKSVQKSTINRVKYHLRDKDNEVLCPIHYVPMILREKREHKGVALDMFFLACPHPKCPQLFKLKSPAQLAAYLSRKEGRGIL
ncbi:MAG: hypothetical protein RIM23_02835 [Coleofasciculus sp. G3-WIS-01]|uniref:hypothetical protein n=1 Tax=Coleofasciculus sp. G3-WIS-01 TaxID=3069528 RepID=UPI0032F552EF